MKTNTTCPAALVFALVFPFVSGFDLMQSRNRAVEDGNAKLKGGKAEEALGAYDKALGALPTDPGVRFNRGAALFALSRYEDAIQEFLRATEAKAPGLKAKAFYNLGNSFFKAEKFGEAVEAYKRSLTLDPGQMAAKWNLELALKMKKEEEKKQQEKQKDKENQKNQDNKDNQENQDNQDKNDQKKDPKDQPPDPSQEQKPEPSQDEKPEEPPESENKSGATPPEKEQDMREVEAILDSLERSPKELEKERARLRAIRRAPPVKDW